MKSSKIGLLSRAHSIVFKREGTRQELGRSFSIDKYQKKVILKKMPLPGCYAPVSDTESLITHLIKMLLK